MVTPQLINKYHVAAPRYTSYPTVPYWNQGAPDIATWKKSAQMSFEQSNGGGISLYIHLPFCESLCTYCGCNTRITKNHAVEEPYIHTLLQEWRLYLNLFQERPLIKEIHLGGGTPTFFHPQNLKLLIDGLLKDAKVHPQAEFSFEGHPNNTTKEHLQALYDLGFRRMSLGIQDFDPVVQQTINRIQSFEQVKEVTQQAREIGFHSVNYDLIYGLPKQNAAGLADTLQKIKELMPDRIAFYSYAHVPWLKPGQRHFTEADLPGVKEKQHLYESGRDAFTAMGYDEIGMDHFALPHDSLFKAEAAGKLHRNFMGYTHQYTQLMVGLGVSSISDTWYAFAQNVKKVEEYTALVAAGEFPLLKTHILDQEDLIIRKHILNLMCKGETSWNGAHEQCYSFFEGLERMQVLAQDKLVEISENKIIVSADGKRFLRNICMTLDSRMWRDQPSTPLFSMAG
jgi:oxygen-independent coproporphyrinogen-3 oxidase